MSKQYKWGYIARDGQWVVAPSYDDAGEFHDGLAVVKLDWSRGYIDLTGRMVIEPRFEAAGNFSHGVAAVKIDGLTRFINNRGEFVEPPGDFLLPQPEVTCGFEPDFEIHDGRRRFIAEGKYGFLDSSDEVVIRPVYTEALDFSEQLAAVRKGKSSPWGYIDLQGRAAIPVGFKQAGSFREGLAPVLIAVEV